jgi:hypothetical protein
MKTLIYQWVSIYADTEVNTIELFMIYLGADYIVGLQQLQQQRSESCKKKRR